MRISNSPELGSKSLNEMTRQDSISHRVRIRKQKSSWHWFSLLSNQLVAEFRAGRWFCEFQSGTRCLWLKFSVWDIKAEGVKEKMTSYCPKGAYVSSSYHRFLVRIVSRSPHPRSKAVCHFFVCVCSDLLSSSRQPNGRGAQPTNNCMFFLQE